MHFSVHGYRDRRASLLAAEARNLSMFATANKGGRQAVPLTWSCLSGVGVIEKVGVPSLHLNVCHGKVTAILPFSPFQLLESICFVHFTTVLLMWVG